MWVPDVWTQSLRLDGIPYRLHDYGHVSLRPPGVADVSLDWHVVNWLEDREEWKNFQEILVKSGDIDREDLRWLYPELVRIPIEFIFECKVIQHAELGPCLEIRYSYPDKQRCGIVLYAVAPTGDNDVLMTSYEGTEPAFSEYAAEAIESMNSIYRM
jgi:hypothetical protein